MLRSRVRSVMKICFLRIKRGENTTDWFSPPKNGICDFWRKKCADVKNFFYTVTFEQPKDTNTHTHLYRYISIYTHAQKSGCKTSQMKLLYRRQAYILGRHPPDQESKRRCWWTWQMADCFIHALCCLKWKTQNLILCFQWQEMESTVQPYDCI